MKAHERTFSTFGYLVPPKGRGEAVKMINERLCLYSEEERDNDQIVEQLMERKIGPEVRKYVLWMGWWYLVGILSRVEDGRRAAARSRSSTSRDEFGGAEGEAGPPGR